MPELPEVEVLVRHLRPLLVGRTIRAVDVRRSRVVRPNEPGELSRALQGATFTGLDRRGKYLLFSLTSGRTGSPLVVLGHLGMTGRMYLLPADRALPKHAAVVLDLGPERFVFEDTRYFGRISLETAPAKALGPEPLLGDFTAAYLRAALRKSKQAVKVKLLDQKLVAGVGNIYASEALHRAGISPLAQSCRISTARAQRLWRAVRFVLRRAIQFGSTVPLEFRGTGDDRLFYYGRAKGSGAGYEEKLQVYDRGGLPCRRCGTPIRRIVQAGRSTFYCPSCQPRTSAESRLNACKAP